MSIEFLMQKDGSMKIIKSYYDLTAELSAYFPINYDKDTEGSYQLRVESLSDLVVMCAQILTNEKLKEQQEQIAQAIEAECHDPCWPRFDDCNHNPAQTITCVRGCTHKEDAEIARNFGKEN